MANALIFRRYFAERVKIITDSLLVSLYGSNFTNTPNTTLLVGSDGTTTYATPNNFAYTTSSGSDENGGIKFDGVNDYLVTNSIAITDEFSWEIICKSSTAADMFVLDHRSADVGIQPMYLTSLGSLQFYSTTDIKDSNTDAGIFKFDGKYHQIVVTIDNTNIKTYYDGTLVKTTAGNISAYTACSLTIGSRHSFTACFNGTVKNVRTYEKALTLEEIQQNYNASI